MITGLAQSGLHNAVALLGMVIPIQPAAASSIAESVDQLYYLLTGITLFFTVLIFSVILYFMVKYRRRSPDEKAPEVHSSLVLELAWTIIPSIICVFLFVATAEVYVRNSRPPASSSEIFVIGKQWMWHLQHSEGPREINELHVPVGTPIRLTMTSQDVIHDFYIPAFRVKKDVVPGRYSSIWFQATEIGTYHLFCAQYCGTSHSGMIGWVYVMSPADYAAWLASGEKNESMTEQGSRLFDQFGCGTCHMTETKGLGPSLVGVYGKPQKLVSGEVRTVDETMLRESILTPNAILVPGYAPVMPTYKGQMDEEQMLQLIAYIKSLGSPERNQQ